MESIKTLAAAVEKDHAAYVRAKTQKGEAEDELLAVLLAIVQPALPAICSIEWVGNSRFRAIKMPAGFILTESGVFYSPKDEIADLDDVLEEISVTDIATVLSGALAAQAGKRTKISETIRREARTIEAIVLALKQGGIK